MAGILTSAVLLLYCWSSAQAQPALKPICVGIVSLEAAKPQRSCCQGQVKGQCLNWEQMFPESKRRPSPSAQKSNQITPFMQVQKPTIIFDSNVSRSEGAAKDAVIQMGVNKLLDAITLRSDTVYPGTKSGHQPNFFQRMQHNYERIFKPRAIGGNATLAPQLDVGLDLSEASISSMKAGVKIEF